MQKLLCSICTEWVPGKCWSTNGVMREKKKSRWIGNSKTDGDWLSTGRYRGDNMSPREMWERHWDALGSRWSFCSGEEQRASSSGCGLWGQQQNPPWFPKAKAKLKEGGWWTGCQPPAGHCALSGCGSSLLMLPQIHPSGKQYYLNSTIY